MANSPLVSLRIPPETLKRIDKLAEKLYPSRKVGGKPNRSQVILDAIASFLDNENSKEKEENIDERIDQILQDYQKHLEKEIQSYIDKKFSAYAYNLEQGIYSHGKVIRLDK